MLAPFGARSPLTQLVGEWSEQHATKVDLIFDESPQLARLVDGGTAADVVLLFDPTRLDRLVGEGHVSKDTRVRLVADGLVVVVQGRRRVPPRDLWDLTRDHNDEAILLPPAESAEGIATLAVLNALGVDDDFGGRGRSTRHQTDIVPAVRDGKAAAGILAGGSARAEPGVSIAFAITTPGATPLLLEGGVVSHARQPAAAATLLAVLASAPATAAFFEAGFVSLDGSAPEQRPRHAGDADRTHSSHNGPARPGIGPAEPNDSQRSHALGPPGPPPGPNASAPAPRGGITERGAAPGDEPSRP